MTYISNKDPWITRAIAVIKDTLLILSSHSLIGYNSMHFLK